MRMTGRITLLWARPKPESQAPKKPDGNSVRVAAARMSYTAKGLIEEVERRSTQPTHHDRDQLHLPFRKGIRDDTPRTN